MTHSSTLRVQKFVHIDFQQEKNEKSSELKSAILLTLGLRVGTSVTGLDVVGATTGEADGQSVIGFRVGGSYRMNIVRGQRKDVVLFDIDVSLIG